MNPKLLHILQHSLGLDEYGRGRNYRNHFCAGGADVELCDELVEMGFMVEFKQTSAFPYPTFGVTAAGKEAIRKFSPEPPKLTRGQKRYEEWLRVSDCYPDMTFGEWLQRGKTV